MLYCQFSVNIVAYQDCQGHMPWPIRRKLNDRFCNKIKRLYKCEWTHGLGDHTDTYFSFYFLDNRTFNQHTINAIKAHLKTMGTIINEFYDSPTKYKHNILKHYDAIDWPTWYRRVVFVDCNMPQYKKVFGSYWYFRTYTNPEGVTSVHKYSYVQKVEIRNYKQ